MNGIWNGISANHVAIFSHPDPPNEESPGAENSLTYAFLFGWKGFVRFEGVEKRPRQTFNIQHSLTVEMDFQRSTNEI